MKLKRERHEVGERAIKDWYAKRHVQIDQKAKLNKESEWAYNKLREEQKRSKNPWEKIIENCEMNKSKYSGA